MRISDWSSDVCSSDLLSIPSFANVARKFSIPSTRSRKQPSACQKRSFAPSAKMASKPFTNEEVEDFIMYTSRSEEHTSELQSLMRISYAVFCLKKKKDYINTNTQPTTQSTQ